MWEEDRATRGRPGSACSDRTESQGRRKARARTQTPVHLLGGESGSNVDGGRDGQVVRRNGCGMVGSRWCVSRLWSQDIRFRKADSRSRAFVPSYPDGPYCTLTTSSHVPLVPTFLYKQAVLERAASMCSTPLTTGAARVGRSYMLRGARASDTLKPIGRIARPPKVQQSTVPHADATILPCRLLSPAGA